MTAPLAVQKLAHYRILERLGAGGMGEVYRAHDERLDRDVAIKILAAGTASDPTARARLLREARAAAALNHPNVCTMHEVGEADGQVFIAMELIEGQPLNHLIHAEGLAVDHAIGYAVQIADALAHAHDRGVIHRDLKTSNVLVGARGRLKVVDFGLAKRMSSEDLVDASTDSDVALTQPGMIIGTLPYMAPEQFRCQPADARSDVWALGVVLYELISGKRPFRGRTRFELSSAILTQPPAPLPARVPPGLQAVIERCLAKEPDRRYQRAGEVQAALEAVQTDAVSPLTAWRPRLSRVRLALAAGASLAALAALLAVDAGGVRHRLMGGANTGIKLAVLPFQNLTGDPQQEYFSDGLTEEMITQLGRLHPQRLSVIARTSTMRYKGTAKAPEEIGRELGVDYLLESSVRREGPRVRINAALIRVGDQTQQWSESYERELAGILSLQSDLARGVAASLALTLLPEEQARLSRARPVIPEVYESYLKGRQHTYLLTPADLDTALQYFEAALQKDPDYALAYTGIATVWSARQQMGFAPPREATPRGRAATAKALTLDGSLAEAHHRLATIKAWSDWDWAGAESEFQKAIALNPSYPDVRAFYSHYLQIVGRPAEAMPQIARALELDPFNPLFQALYGVDLMCLRRYDDALVQFRSALKTAPGNPVALNGLQNALHNRGLYGEALAAEKAQRTASGDVELVAALDRGLSEGGYSGALRREADVLAARALAAHTAPVRVATLYLRAGEQERGLEWLARSFEARDPNLPYLAVGPNYDSLRGDPRFQDLLKRMNLPPAEARP